MPETLTIFDVIKVVIFWVSPAIFLEGLLLLLLSAAEYKRLENLLSKQIKARGKRRLKIENNVYGFHNWLVQRKILVGIICIICALVLFFFLKR